MFERAEGATGARWRYPDTFMTDAADDASLPYGKSWSPKVTQSLSEDGKTLTLTADGEWPAPREREYPVVIDPTIRIIPTPTTSQDVTTLRRAPLELPVELAAVGRDDGGGRQPPRAA